VSFDYAADLWISIRLGNVALAASRLTVFNSEMFCQGMDNIGTVCTPRSWQSLDDNYHSSWLKSAASVCCCIRAVEAVAGFDSMFVSSQL